MTFPFESIPGWPDAPDASSSWLLILCILAPLALGVIVALVAWTPKLSAKARAQVGATDPVAIEAEPARAELAQPLGRETAVAPARRAD